MSSICQRRFWLGVLCVAFLGIYLSMPRGREPTCSLDYTANMTTEQNIKFYGYPYEKHVVQTEDGYILSLIRLSRPESDKLPVLLVHGFVVSSNVWVAMGPEGSLGYNLYDEGYDVWLADLRGNSYSNQHNFLKDNDTKFWDFSWDDIGLFDQAAFIDYVLKETGHETLVHVGYSMGSGTQFVLSSTRPEYKAKIEAHIALAPAVFLKNNKLSKNVIGILMFMNELFIETPGSYFYGQPAHIIRAAVNSNFLFKFGYIHFSNYVLGPSDSYKNESVLQVAIHNLLLGSSTKVEHQMRQFRDSGGRFLRYDYGDEKTNFNKYGQGTPPEYDLSNIDIPTYIFYGATDKLCSELGMFTLKEALPGPVELIKIGGPFFNHGDFVISNKAKFLSNPKILEKIRLVNENHKRKKLSVQTKETEGAVLGNTDCENSLDENAKGDDKIPFNFTFDFSNTIITTDKAPLEKEMPRQSNLTST